MKFTNGFWLTRKNIQPLFAVEYLDHEVKGETLVIHATTSHYTGRGSCLNSALLTVELSSPMEGVIGVKAYHYAGGEDAKGFSLYGKPVHAEISEDKEHLSYASGRLTVRINKAPSSWRMEFIDKEKGLLTESGNRCLARYLDSTDNASYASDALSLDVGEYVYGLGERFTPFVKNGQSVDIWNEDGGTASEQAYKNIPFSLSSKGYGVFVDDTGDVSYEVASEKVERMQFSVKGESLKYFVFSGPSAKEALTKYVRLTGMPALPPAWSFGLWLTTSFTTDYSEKITSSFIDGMKDRDIPLSVFHYDCFWMKGQRWCDFVWDDKTFPDPKGMIRRNHEKGLKVCVWINPYIAQASNLFREGKEKGYFIKNEDGTVWQTDLWQAGMAIVDFTNPEATAWYQSQLEKLLDEGVDCFKTDFGERIPVKGVRYHDGSDSRLMHNFYTFLYNQAVFTLLERKKGKGEAALFARSATAGSQQFPIHWGGDCSATYPSMAETLRGGLSLASSGFAFWSHDIGGFESTASADVYKRWCQFGLLSSHSRLHGSSSYRVPWLFDEEACDVLRTFVKLKCSMMPYLYALAALAHETGVPMLRPMFLEFPENREMETLDRQYMLGDRLLVAPIFKESGEVEYAVPSGGWVNLLTGDLVESAGWHKEKHGYLTLPLLVRPDTLVPFGSDEERPDYDYTKDLTLKAGFFHEGGKDAFVICDLHGKEAGVVKAEMKGGVIRVKAEGVTVKEAVSLVGQKVVL
jgi:alpha-D-xyloside xylohydrolase